MWIYIFLSQVFLERFNASDAFVYNFDGYASEHKVTEKFRRLRHKLEMKEQPFSEDYFAVQAFDPYVKLVPEE